MSMVDDMMVITRYEDRGDHIMFFNDHDQEAFSVMSISSQSKLTFLIPFVWYYTWDNSERRYLHS